VASPPCGWEAGISAAISFFISSRLHLIDENSF
jgi:hypothetical protein